MSRKEREKGMPKFCYRRKESPFIWYKFKVNGRFHTGSTETADKKLAEAIVGKLRSEAVGGKVKQRPTDIPLREIIATVLDKRKSTDSYRRSTLNVVDFLTKELYNEKVSAAEIKPDDVNEYHAWRVKRASESTINRELGYFQSCINYAIKRMKLNLEDPVQGWERFDEESVARDRTLTYEERARLLADDKFPQMAKDIMVWACKTGMRKGEILAAKWSHINWAERSIKVKTEKKKKRGAVSDPFRHVPLHLYPMEILKRRRLEGWEKRSEYIFCDEHGGKLSRHGQVTTAFEWACARNKINDLRFHDLRHTFATDYLRANKDIKALKGLAEIMGHSEERITQRYTHLWPEDKNNQIALLPVEPGFKMAEKPGKSSYAGVTVDN
jgi:integrase